MPVGTALSRPGDPMTIFPKVFRLAGLFGWHPLIDPGELDTYLNAQWLGQRRVRRARRALARARGDPTQARSEPLDAGNGPERSLPDIPDVFRAEAPRSLMEDFAENGKDWLRECMCVLSRPGVGFRE